MYDKHCRVKEPVAPGGHLGNQSFNFVITPPLSLKPFENNTHTQVTLSALRPLTCNSTRPQHTLQMFADHYGPRQPIPWETINQGLLQPQGELYPNQTILTIAAGISSSSFVRVSTRQLAVSSLSKGISSTLNFHESNGTDGTRTRNLSHRERAPYRLS